MKRRVALFLIIELIGWQQRATGLAVDPTLLIVFHTSAIVGGAAVFFM